MCGKDTLEGVVYWRKRCNLERVFGGHDKRYQCCRDDYLKSVMTCTLFDHG